MKTFHPLPAEMQARPLDHVLPGHEKVYSGERFLTSNPGWAFVCATCKATGIDHLGVGGRPPSTDLARYADLTGSEPLARLARARARSRQ